MNIKEERRNMEDYEFILEYINRYRMSCLITMCLLR